ncbi:hypothetical protein CTAYLR_010634 [Chrysophaeum taylorii]|uniref:Methyltransferase domain-containing protein n=1 Tax=Chrysophaeum taylorii TaxID=2483200 RepID=A0AAD7UMY8_9STRA|nr:hypothetical protein CTAYLR_010634 [Chrysophaeum taylorii]
MRSSSSSSKDDGVSRRGEKWNEMYAKAETPWETQRPASQVVAWTRSRSVRGLRCVELCCGTGASAVYLAREGGAALVVGLEISEVAVEAARARAAAAGVGEKCLFVRCDALEVGLADVCGMAGIEARPFEAGFDCQGFQMLWAVDPDLAGVAVASLLAPGATYVTVAGNANEYRADGAGSSLTVAELVGALSPPTFFLESLVETRFDTGECEDEEGPTLPPLAWRAALARTRDDSILERPRPPHATVDSPGSARNNNKSPPKRLTPKSSRRDTPPVIARKLTSFARDAADESASSETALDDAVDAALSVDGSVAPSDCGSDATSFAGADGFENIAASRAAAARAERARAEGDAPWVRWWDRRANAYDALCAAQPVLRRLAKRVARAALHWAFNYDSLRLFDDSVVVPVAPSPENRFEHATIVASDDDATTVALTAVDLAAGSGQCAWALADLLGAELLRAELVEPSHSMAALARARAGALCRSRGVHATVWQIPAERCHDRLPARLQASVDLLTCSSAMECLNYHDMFETAAALLRPGGAFAFDLAPEAYEGTRDDDLASSWVGAVKGALLDRGLLLGDDDSFILNLKSRPPLKPPCSVSAIATAAAAAGLRLASCDVANDAVAGDFFVAYRAMSTSWLSEPFAGMPKPDAKHLRSVVLLDAASRAARTTTLLRTALFVLVKPSARVDAHLAKLYKRANQAQENDDDDLLGRRLEPAYLDDPPSARPITQSINNDHFGWAGPAKV